MQPAVKARINAIFFDRQTKTSGFDRDLPGWQPSNSYLEP